VGVEHVGRFADVVVDGGEDQVLGVHGHVVTAVTCTVTSREGRWPTVATIAYVMRHEGTR
jgi:hypothetical protein